MAEGYEAADTLDLRDYLAVLSRRRWTVVATVVLVVAAALTVTFLQTPTYQATTQVAVQPVGSATGQDGLSQSLAQGLFGRTELETQRELARSVPVAQRAVEDLGLDTDPESVLERIEVSLLTETRILEIRASHTDPEQAAALSQGFADAYLDHRRDRAVEQLLAATDELRERTQQIRDRIETIDQQLATADPSEADTLREERASLLTQLGQASAQLTTLRTSDALSEGGGEVLRPAVVPSSPSSPRPVRTGVLAVVLGAMLGIGLAFLRDFLDDAVRTDEDATRATGEPVLGHIAHARREDRAERSGGGVALVHPGSAAAEGYRTLRTNVRFLSVDDPVRSLLLTSSNAAEGKTTVACNLAVTAAAAGLDVLLVDADLRHPGADGAFGVGNAAGLSDVIVGEVDLDAAVTDVGIEHLEVLTTGPVPPNPAELLGSAAMAELLPRLAQRADLVIYDTPPVLAVADPLELAPYVGAALLVVDTGTTGRHPLRAAADRLRGVRAPLAGTVLNNIAAGETYYGYYYPYPYPAGGTNGDRSGTRRPTARGAQPDRDAPEPATPHAPDAATRGEQEPATRGEDDQPTPRDDEPAPREADRPAPATGPPQSPYPPPAGGELSPPADRPEGPADRPAPPGDTRPDAPPNRPADDDHGVRGPRTDLP